MRFRWAEAPSHQESPFRNPSKTRETMSLFSHLRGKGGKGGRRSGGSGRRRGWPILEMIIIQGLVGWRKEGAAFYRIQFLVLSGYSPKANWLFSQLAGEPRELGKRASSGGHGPGSKFAPAGHVLTRAVGLPAHNSMPRSPGQPLIS